MLGRGFHAAEFLEDTDTVSKVQGNELPGMRKWGFGKPGHQRGSPAIPDGAAALSSTTKG